MDYQIWEEKNLIDQSKNLSKKEKNDKCDTISDIEIKSNKKILIDITGQKNRGIYKIVNKCNNKYYVGRTNDFDKRWKKHKSDLNKNRHPNDMLQHSWNKYGENNFEFIIVECSNDCLLRLEQKYLTIAENEQDKCYNLNFNSLYGNDSLSEYSKEKIRNSLLGRKHTEETINKISESKIGAKHHFYGKKHNDITRLKMSNAHKGKKHTDESKKRISESKIGRPISQETRLKISNAIKNKKLTNIKQV